MRRLLGWRGGRIEHLDFVRMMVKIREEIGGGGLRTWSVTNSRVEWNTNDADVELCFWFGKTLDVF